MGLFQEKTKYCKTYSWIMKVRAVEMRTGIMDIASAVMGDVVCAGFTPNMWTSTSGDPFMRITLHFINKNWRLHRWSPFVAFFLDSHTGKNIFLGLNAMLEELCLVAPQVKTS